MRDGLPRDSEIVDQFGMQAAGGPLVKRLAGQNDLEGDLEAALVRRVAGDAYVGNTAYVPIPD